MLDKIKRIDILQYTLVLAGEFISDSDKFGKALLSNAGDDKEAPYKPFIKLLKNDDDTVPLLSAKVLNYLIAATETVPASVLEPFFDWYRTLTTAPDQNTDLQNLAVQALSSILRSAHNRSVFRKNTSNSDVLMTLLKKHGGIQLQYNSLLVIWLLSFDEPVAKELSTHDMISLLNSICQASAKEKITRIAIATLRNLATLAPTSLNLMLQSDILTLVKTFKARQWHDEDIKDDLVYLEDVLTARKTEMTSFEAYSTEVDSGKLVWSPPHKSDEFWSANAKQLVKDDYSLVKQLARILSTAQDHVTLAVACHDIGAFVKNYPDGRTAVQKSGAKGKILELMGSGDGDLRYEALQTVQILLSKAWIK